VKEHQKVSSGSEPSIFNNTEFNSGLTTFQSFAHNAVSSPALTIELQTNFPTLAEEAMTALAVVGSRKQANSAALRKAPCQGHLPLLHHSQSCCCTPQERLSQ